MQIHAGREYQFMAAAAYVRQLFSETVDLQDTSLTSWKNSVC